MSLRSAFVVFRAQNAVGTHNAERGQNVFGMRNVERGQNAVETQNAERSQTQNADRIRNAERRLAPTAHHKRAG